MKSVIMDNNKDNLKGIVVGVALGQKRGESKLEAPYIDLREGFGVLGDAHGGTEKQVSVAAIEDIEEMNQEFNLDAKVGDFAENITTKGIDLDIVKPGDEIHVGSALLKVVSIGKNEEEMKTHSFSFKGYKLLPTKGVFCKVVNGGRVNRDDSICLTISKDIDP